MKLNLKENAYKIAFSLITFPDLTQGEMKEKLDWLNYISEYGISLYLDQAEKLGLISCRARKGGDGTLEWRVVKNKVKHIKKELDKF